MREIKRDKYGHFLKGHKEQSAENNSQWKGDKVGYFSLHNWVEYHLGKPRLCDECGTTKAKKYEWANISGKYRRLLSDWKRLCTSCHRLLDGHSHKAWRTRRLQNAA